MTNTVIMGKNLKNNLQFVSDTCDNTPIRHKKINQCRFARAAY